MHHTLLPGHEMYWAPVRDRSKRLNGHIIIGMSTTSVKAEDRAQLVRTENLGEYKSEDDLNDHCAIRYFLQSGEMDYLASDVEVLPLRSSTVASGTIVRMGLRAALDSVCSLSSAPSLIKLKPYAEDIVQALRTNVHLQPILPSVDEFKNAIPFSKFLVGTIARYHLYYRGSKSEYYVGDSNNGQQQPTPWNIDQDSLSEEAREEWITWERTNKSTGRSTVKDGASVRPTKRVLEARVWMKNSIKIVNTLKVKDRLLKQTVYQACPQHEMDIKYFGRILKDVFPDLEGDHNWCYMNLAWIS
ncbi:uncharacterized protein LOC118436448 isoform X1 [Folsomia candida]|uniref:uncharacterized protein LOC118436448 isoform X1 n=1 Tax=Folsomia candida TaxID=158441 RepID=UPI0016050113|nr:uncharacterized protein LOC118436448 isoform X1 [Folsomia candida]XP_035710467.1 uncharacterized protein LOC118436448 isoform X1 [Folsomia candida]